MLYWITVIVIFFGLYKVLKIIKNTLEEILDIKNFDY
jgi:hypothetical protein